MASNAENVSIWWRHHGISHIRASMAVILPYIWHHDICNHHDHVGRCERHTLWTFCDLLVHQSGVTGALWRHKSPATRLHVPRIVQASNKENIEAPLHWRISPTKSLVIYKNHGDLGSIHVPIPHKFEVNYERQWLKLHGQSSRQIYSSIFCLWVQLPLIPFVHNWHKPWAHFADDYSIMIQIRRWEFRFVAIPSMVIRNPFY